MLLSLYSLTAITVPVAASVSVSDTSGSIERNGRYACAYQFGQLVTLSAISTDAESGDPLDPSGVTVYVEAPDGSTTAYAYTSGNSGIGQVVRNGPGSYSLDIVADESGPWIYDWVGTGTAPVASGDVYFQVEQTVFTSLIG